VLTPQVSQTIQIVQSLRAVNGGLPGGTNVLEWPAKLLDVWRSAELYFRSEENAISKAFREK